MPKRAKRTSDATVAAVYQAMDAIAPFAGAENWDNVGLLAGRPEWPARRILTAIDLTDAVATEALHKKVDTLVLYHPPIFKGIRAITPAADCPTTLLPDLLAARIAILATHTAFDVAEGGTNDLLLDLIKPVSRRPLTTEESDSNDYKLVVFVPRENVERLREALSAAGAGVIGHYSRCSYELDGHGTFMGDETTNPAIGRKQVLETVAETRLEMVAPRSHIGGIVRALYTNHPYEEPAFDIYPLCHISGCGKRGLGRIGKLSKSTPGTEIVKRLAAGGVDISIATSVGNLKRRFREVIVAAGAFGTDRFRDSEALAITGEFKHHDALALQKRGVTAICLGHYASERLVLGAINRRLGAALKSSKIFAAISDRSPFQSIRI